MTLVLACTLMAPAPTLAQDDDNLSGPHLQEGLDLLEQGTRKLLESLILELGPAWVELREMLDNLNSYYPPEVLPNGDIIIRRKVPLTGVEPESSETEL